MHLNTIKSTIIISALVLVVAFFMPWFKIFAEITAWDWVSGKSGDMFDPTLRLVAATIPMSGILIFRGLMSKKESYAIPKSILFRIPGAALFIIFFAIVMKFNSSGSGFSRNGFSQLISMMGLGFWLSVTASILLSFFVKKSGDQAISRTNSQQTTYLNYGILLIILGVGLLIYSQTANFTETSTYDIYDQDKALGLPDKYNTHMLDTETRYNTKKQNNYVYWGLISCYLGGLLIHRKQGFKLRADTDIPVPEASADNKN